MTILPVPYFTIGVIGHRPNRLLAPDAVAADIGMLLDMALASAGHSAVMLVTALAEGADRIAARQALRRKMLLKAVLPFARAEYELDFPESAGEFSPLLQAATQIVDLPGQRRDAPAAYDAANREILRGAVLLLAVWDGGPSGGQGGTTDAIARAAHLGLPVIWVDARGQKPPSTLPPGDDLYAVMAHTAAGLR